MKLQRSGRKLECIPQRESILRGLYDPGHEASYEGAVEGLTITRPIKPLGRASPATSSTTAHTVAPKGTPPSAATNLRTALGLRQIHSPNWFGDGVQGLSRQGLPCPCPPSPVYRQPPPPPRPGSGCHAAKGGEMCSAR